MSRTDARQRARRLEIVAVDHGNIGTDRSVLGHVAVEAAADLDFDILGSDVIEKLSASAASSSSTIATTLSSL